MDRDRLLMSSKELVNLFDVKSSALFLSDFVDFQ